MKPERHVRLQDTPRFGRREALGVALAATAAATAATAVTAMGSTAGAAPLGSAARADSRDEAARKASARMPAIYLPHGGGPWPWMDLGSWFSQGERAALTGYLTGLAAGLPRRPKAMVVVSAHWEAPLPTVMTSPRPPIFYDYYGFPPEMYRIPWPAPGEPELAARVRTLLHGAGFRTGEDAERGFDHGTFVPLKLTFPDADVPTVQLSLEEGLDPERHLAMGRALSPLRDQDILLVGSGMSFHNQRDFRSIASPDARAARSGPFDAWLRRIAAEEPAVRDAELVRWQEAPMARAAHPREEHLAPLFVMAGAAGQGRGRIAFHDRFAGFDITAVHFDA